MDYTLTLLVTVLEMLAAVTLLLKIPGFWHRLQVFCAVSPLSEEDEGQTHPRFAILFLMVSAALLFKITSVLDIAAPIGPVRQLAMNTPFTTLLTSPLIMLALTLALAHQGKLLPAYLMVSQKGQTRA